MEELLLSLAPCCGKVAHARGCEGLASGVDGSATVTLVVDGVDRLAGAHLGLGGAAGGGLLEESFLVDGQVGRLFVSRVLLYRVLPDPDLVSTKLLLPFGELLSALLARNLAVRSLAS